ncbi:MAG: hypothetical protein WCR78_07545 [Arcobacteraceae bacterium]
MIYQLLAIEYSHYFISNGNGSNITQIAARLNYDNINIFVLVDSDKDGCKYKENILAIKGIFNLDNVCTLKDLIPEIYNNCTIEDLLGKEFIQSKFNELYDEKFSKKNDLILQENKAFLEQIKIYLQGNEDLKLIKKL